MYEAYNPCGYQQLPGLCLKILLQLGRGPVLTPLHRYGLYNDWHEIIVGDTFRCTGHKDDSRACAAYHAFCKIGLRKGGIPAYGHPLTMRTYDLQPETALSAGLQSLHPSRKYGHAGSNEGSREKEHGRVSCQDEACCAPSLCAHHQRKPHPHPTKLPGL